MPDRGRIMWPSKFGRFLLRLSRGVLAVIGLLAVGVVLALAVEPEGSEGLGQRVYRWLALRKPADPGEVREDVTRRVSALRLEELSRPQAAVASWLARKYRVAPEPIAALVKEAHTLSRSTGLPAHLILAVASIESNFHPYIQSDVGAQGLMQVMPRIHQKRYAPYGGAMSAFDPITNLRVGASVLVDCVRLKHGSIDEGLKFYFGGSGANGEMYVAKVKNEQRRLDNVAAGQPVGTMPEEADAP